MPEPGDYSSEEVKPVALLVGDQDPQSAILDLRQGRSRLRWSFERRNRARGAYFRMLNTFDYVRRADAFLAHADVGCACAEPREPMAT